MGPTPRRTKPANSGARCCRCPRYSDGQAVSGQRADSEQRAVSGRRAISGRKERNSTSPAERVPPKKGFSVEGDPAALIWIIRRVCLTGATPKGPVTATTVYGDAPLER